MQVNMKAKCWDGMRTKELTKVEPIKEQVMTMEKPAIHHTKTLAVVGSVASLMILSNAFAGVHAFAAPVEAVPAMSSEAASKIMHVFDPLINLVVSLSYPIAGVMIAGGCLMIMVQQREAGMKMLQNAAIGYILVQLSPILLQLLVGIGSSV